MIPKYKTNILESFNPQMPSTKVFKIDWDNNRLLPQKVDGIEAIKQAVQVYLAIEYRDCAIMPDWFGVEIKKLHAMPKNYIKANLERLIKTALSVDNRIKRVYDVNIKENGDSFIVDMTIECDEGVFDTEVNIDV